MQFHIISTCQPNRHANNLHSAQQMAKQQPKITDPVTVQYCTITAAVGSETPIRSIYDPFSMGLTNFLISSQPSASLASALVLCCACRASCPPLPLQRHFLPAIAFCMMPFFAFWYAHPGSDCGNGGCSIRHDGYLKWQVETVTGKAYLRTTIVPGSQAHSAPRA